MSITKVDREFTEMKQVTIVICDACKEEAASAVSPADLPQTGTIAWGIRKKWDICHSCFERIEKLLHLTEEVAL